MGQPLSNHCGAQTAFSGETEQSFWLWDMLVGELPSASLLLLWHQAYYSDPIPQLHYIREDQSEKSMEKFNCPRKILIHGNSWEGCVCPPNDRMAQRLITLQAAR